MSCRETKQEYAIFLDSCFNVIISNLECVKCFENQNKCKIKSYSKVSNVKKDDDDVIYIKNKCKCK